MANTIETVLNLLDYTADPATTPLDTAQELAIANSIANTAKIRLNGANLEVSISGGRYFPLQVGITPNSALIDEGPSGDYVSGYREILPEASLLPTSIIWYVLADKVDKIVEKTITYTGVLPTTIEWLIYNVDGSTVGQTVTDTITYSGIFESTRTRVIT